MYGGDKPIQIALYLALIRQAKKNDMDGETLCLWDG